MMTDLELLRRFEPVLRFTQGEMFFPAAVDGYLRRCRLWRTPSGADPVLLLEHGQVTPDTLAAAEANNPGGELYLQYIDAPLDPLQTERWLQSDDHPDFSSAGRLARTGIVGRLAESLFDVSLLVRGRVPRGATGRAHALYRDMRAEDPRYVYYGRVLRDGGYTILHYLFFYAMNDWRSSFHGVNDHESDWEQVFVFITEEPDGPVPHWVAFAAHDFKGDDLRRRWDDPELTIIDGTHVVVHAAAGSHAAYVLPGEYLMNVEPARLKPLKRALYAPRAFFHDVLDPHAPPLPPDQPLLSLAFVDYARGDGLAIGPGGAAAWSPELLDDALPWVGGYHGLWGLDTRDPLGGERAPAGPKFNRDGSVRQTWADPLGWCGLDKVPPPDALIPTLAAATTALEAELAAVQAEHAAQRDALRTRALITAALGLAPTGTAQSARTDTELQALQTETADLAARAAELQETHRLAEQALAAARRGERPDPQAHLQRRAVPEPPPSNARLRDLWAAASGLVLVATVMALVAFRPINWPLWIAVALLLFGLVEASFRRQTANYLVTTSIILAAIAAVALFVAYWRWAVPALLVGIFLYAFLNNLRELRAGRPPKTTPQP